MPKPCWHPFLPSPVRRLIEAGKGGCFHRIRGGWTFPVRRVHPPFDGCSIAAPLIAMGSDPLESIKAAILSGRGGEGRMKWLTRFRFDHHGHRANGPCD